VMTKLADGQLIPFIPPLPEEFSVLSVHICFEQMRGLHKTQKKPVSSIDLNSQKTASASFHLNSLKNCQCPHWT